MATTVLVVGVIAATPSAGSASATADHLPWRTIVTVAGPAGAVYSYNTDSDDPADIDGAGFVGMAGARDVVATPDDDAVFVLGGPVVGDPALVRRWSVVADGELGSAGTPIEVGVGATRLALDPAGRHLYTVNPGSDSITMLDTASGNVEHTFSISGTPTDLVITQDGLYGVVLDEAGGLTLLDLVTGAVVERRVLGSGDVTGIALARGQTLHDGAQRSVVLVADRGGGLVRSVAVEPDATPALLSVRTTSLADVVPESIAVSARDGRVWFADSAHDWLVGLDYDAATATVDSIGHTVELDSDFGREFALDPNGEFADVHRDGATTVKRFALTSGNLVGTVGTYASDEIHLRTTPVQAVTVTLQRPEGWSVMRGTPATITAVPSDPGHVHHYVWDFHDGTGPLTTTDPVVEHTWAVEGRYEVSVVAVTDPGLAVFDGGLSTQSIYSGQQFAQRGQAGARASQIMRVGFPVGLGAPGTFSGTWNLANTPSGYATFTVPDSTEWIELTLAGAAGAPGSPTSGDAICNHLGDDLDCSNDGYPEGGTVAAKVSVPVGPTELVRGGDTLAVVIGSRTNAAHGYLLGGNGGEGAGAGGGGGHGGGGSGIFVVDSARGNPWVVVAPGSGGGGGAGFVKDAGSRGGKADFDSGDDGDRENGVCAAGAVAGGPGQNGGDGGAAPGSGISGGGGGGGGGCNAGSGGPARGEALGGDGGGGGNGYSPYPVTLSCNSGSTAGNDCEDSFVRVVGSFSGGPSLTTPIPDPRIAFDPVAHYVVGQQQTFSLPIGYAAYGGLIPEPEGLPDGLKWLCDGNGLCTIWGTPEPGSGGVYDLDIDLVGDGEPAITLRLTVEEAPAFTQVPVPPGLRPGDAVSLDIATVGMDGRRLGLRGDLPAGLSLVDHADGTGTISGTVESGSEGTYRLRLVVAQDARSVSAGEQPAWAYRDVVLTVSAQNDDPGTGGDDPGPGVNDPGAGDGDDTPGTDDSRDTDSQDGSADHRDGNGAGPLADTGSSVPLAVLLMGLLALGVGSVIVSRPRGRHTTRQRRS